MQAVVAPALMATSVRVQVQLEIPVMQVTMRPLPDSVLSFCQAVVANMGWRPMQRTSTYSNSTAVNVRPLNWATPPVGALMLTMPAVALSVKRVVALGNVIVGVLT